MATSAIKPGKLVALQELEPSSPFFKQGESLRVTGKLQAYSVETDFAIIVDGGVTLKIDTQHLRDMGFRVGSIYQFIGELLIQADNDAILQARVGRNVDGIDLNLYHQSMKLRRQFESDTMKSRATSLILSITSTMMLNLQSLLINILTLRSLWQSFRTERRQQIK